MERKFKSLLIVTIISLFLLVLAGGIVRATGSGLGCPDWPKCFGSYIPPTSVSDLPMDYKEIFKISGKTIADFDAMKTWTEYINRLLGVLIGFFIMGVWILSLKLKRSDLHLLSLLNLILVGFQGWLGSVVVSTHLSPIIVTLHMLFAFIIIFVAIFSYIKVDRRELSLVGSIVGNRLLSILLLTLGAQILLGAQVREQIDILLDHEKISRELIIDQLRWPFWIHRSQSVLVILLSVFIFKNNTHLKKYIIGYTSALLAVIVSALILAYGSIPPWAQPIHLVSAFILISIVFSLLLISKEKDVPSVKLIK